MPVFVDVGWRETETRRGCVPQPALNGGDHDRAARLPAAAVRAGRHGALPTCKKPLEGRSPSVEAGRLVEEFSGQRVLVVAPLRNLEAKRLKAEGYACGHRAGWPVAAPRSRAARRRPTAAGARAPPPWAPAHGYRQKYATGSGGYKPPFGLDLGRCNRTLIGTVIGGVGGGVIGSQIGNGNGRTLAIIGGTILGAIVGAGVGDTMDNLDQNCVGQTLEHAPDGQTIKWNSPAANTDYQVTPTRSYQDANGRYCREYQTNATIAGRTQKVYGTSCRQPDGSWKLVS